MCCRKVYHNDTRPNGEWGYSTRRLCWATSTQGQCHLQEELNLPTFSHLLIVNKLPPPSPPLLILFRLRHYVPGHDSLPMGYLGSPCLGIGIVLDPFAHFSCHTCGSPFRVFSSDTPRVYGRLFFVPFISLELRCGESERHTGNPFDKVWHPPIFPSERSFCARLPARLRGSDAHLRLHGGKALLRGLVRRAVRCLCQRERVRDCRRVCPTVSITQTQADTSTLAT